MQRVKIKSNLFVVLILLLPMQLLALSSDRTQPIQVEADSLEVRDQENISVYTGNVQLSQGSLRFRCERLTLHFDDQNELVLMEMTGAPATFRQLDDQQQELNGQAEQLQYKQSESILILSGKARFSHKGDTIESNRIQVNTENESIQAGSSDPDNRVRMLILPKPQ
jgi:lipopolysaccharide export system protein LptA